MALKLLRRYSFWAKPMAPIYIRCYSQAAISTAGSVMYKEKSRHIRRRHNSIRQLLSSEIIRINYVKSKDNVSDPVLKGLTRDGVEGSLMGMRLWPRKNISWR